MTEIVIDDSFYQLYLMVSWDRYEWYLDEVVERVVRESENWLQAKEQEAQQIEDETERVSHSAKHREETFFRRSSEVLAVNWGFVTCFGFFEEQLMIVCGDVGKARDVPFSVGDIKGGSILQCAKKYCKRLGLEFPSDVPEWREITQYGQIRNKIVHQGGYLDSENLADYAQKEGIVSNGEKHLELTLPYCEKAIGNFKGFMVKLGKVHEDWASELRQGEQIET